MLGLSISSTTCCPEFSAAGEKYRPLPQLLLMAVASRCPDPARSFADEVRYRPPLPTTGQRRCRAVEQATVSPFAGVGHGPRLLLADDRRATLTRQLGNQGLWRRFDDDWVRGQRGYLR